MTLHCINTTYPNGLTDTEWDYLQRLLPPQSAQSKPRRHALQSVFGALFYLVRTGCPWRYLPAHFSRWQTVDYHFCQFSRTGLWVHLYRELHNAERRRIGKDPHLSAALMDSQSIKTMHAQDRTVGYQDAWSGVISALKLVRRWPLKEGNPWLHHVFGDRET